jgi:UDP-2,3-diacylglucosamine pyrophosphatase LpxH
MKAHYKTVFISDLHLGAKPCKSEQLSKFLSSFTCEELYLVGDILDGWQMAKGKSFFPQEHVNVIRKLLTKAKKGTKIYYVIGNHDDFLRQYSDILHTVGNISVANEFLFTSIIGKKYLVTHGDLYDAVVLYHEWVAKFGDTLYNSLVWMNTILNKIRSRYNLEYWSLSGFLKTKVKGALEFMYAFEDLVTKEAKKRSLDGVICGHIHHPMRKIVNEVEYWNDGDWTESCSAIIEHTDGFMEIFYFNEHETRILK